MEVHEEAHGAVTVIRPLGAVTSDEVESLGARLRETRARTLGRLVLDASSIPFIDSEGLELLVDVTNELSRGGQSLKLCGATELVREVLQITDLTDSFEQYADVGTAVRSFL